MANPFGNQAQPSTRKEKAAVVSGAFGNTSDPSPAHSNRGTAPHKGPKLHGIDIEAASNGYQLNHRVKKFRKNDREEGGGSHPSFEDMVSTKHVINDDHPMAAHIQALHEYCTDCNDD